MFQNANFSKVDFRFVNEHDFKSLGIAEYSLMLCVSERTLGYGHTPTIFILGLLYFLSWFMGFYYEIGRRSYRQTCQVFGFLALT